MDHDSKRPPDFSSELPGFHKLDREARLRRAADLAQLSDRSVNALSGARGLTPDLADHMVENALGVFGLPLGLATNFIINGHERLIPMVIEEPSVVAGAWYMAKLARSGGGFHAAADRALMIGQVQLLQVADQRAAGDRILASRDRLLAQIDELNPSLVAHGGGAREIEVRTFEDSPVGPMLVVHLLIDTRDAMGANTVNTAANRWPRSWSA